MYLQSVCGFVDGVGLAVVVRGMRSCATGYSVVSKAVVRWARG